MASFGDLVTLAGDKEVSYYKYCSQIADTGARVVRERLTVSLFEGGQIHCRPVVTQDHHYVISDRCGFCTFENYVGSPWRTTRVCLTQPLSRPMSLSRQAWSHAAGERSRPLVTPASLGFASSYLSEASGVWPLDLYQMTACADGLIMVAS